MTELISGPQLIFDFQGKAGAVLLDKVNNPANHACLEILGLKHECDARSALSYFLKKAKELIPQEKSGFQFGLPESSSFGPDFFQIEGLSHYYDTFEMRHSSIQDLVHVDHPQILSAQLADAQAVYQILCQAFANNPETGIPDEASWRQNFLRSPSSHFCLWKEGENIWGFANLMEEENEVEVRTIGVLPEHRGQGIGRALLGHCLQMASRRGHKTAVLSVAAKNQTALGLYEHMGFKVLQRHHCYRFDR